MVDTTTTITIDSDLRKQAKEAMINISALTEQAIKDKLNVREVKESIKCEFCGKDEPKAWFEYLSNGTEVYHDGITWLCPNEKWICIKCLAFKSRCGPPKSEIEPPSDNYSIVPQHV